MRIIQKYRIAAPYRVFSDVWETFATSRDVYFKTREYLFRLTRDRIQAWKATTGFHKSFFVYGRLFLRQFDVGLMEFIQDKPVVVNGGERFAREMIYAMLPIDMPDAGGTPVPNGRILIGTRTQGFFLFDGASITPFHTEADTFLKTNLLYNGARLKDGTLALATWQGGVVRLDRGGKILGILDKTSGLIDDTVHFIQSDGQSGLWLAHDKGLSHLEWPAPLTLFDERSGLKGSVLSLQRHKGTLYAGTGQGVFILLPPLRNPATAFRGYRFKPVAGVKNQSFGFLSFGEALLVANAQGVFEIRGHEAFLIRPSHVVAMCLNRSKSDPARIFVGLQNGLASVYHRDFGQGSWIDEGKVPGITDEVHNMVETEDGRLWLGTQSQGVLRVTFSGDWKGGATGSAPLVERFGSDQGFPAGTYRWEKTPFLRFAEMSIEVIQPDDDGVVWFGGPDGLIRYNPRVPKNYSPAYSALVRRVKKAGDQLLFGGVLEAKNSVPIPHLRYAENSLHFEFALPAFDQPESNRYQIRMQGLEKGWSSWTAQNVKEYTNLVEGSYAFRVKARNIYEHESGEALFRFIVSPPWYRTWLAYLGYAVIGLGLLAGGARAYTFKLHREKERLEKLVTLRTQELKKTNLDLADANAELERLSLTDPLTQLPNRRNFELIFAQEWKRCSRESQPLSLLMIDIDFFKSFNDTYGHPVGDDCLKQIAASIHHCASRAGDFVARLGGEEFVVILPNTHLQGAELMAERVRKSVEELRIPHSGSGISPVITVSVGIFTVIPERETENDTLIAAADQALYKAKRLGRNRIYRVSP